MHKITIPGLIITTVAFFVIAGFLGSQITVAGNAVDLPGLPSANNTTTTLFDAAWEAVTDFLADLINPF